MAKKRAASTPPDRENPICEKQKPGNEIEEIFASKKKKKKESDPELINPSVEGTNAEQKKVEKKKTTTKMKDKSKSKNNSSKEDGFSDRPSRPRRRTQDGLAVYSAEELGLGKADAGGPGCSSFGHGAMMELGPFRVKSDGQTLQGNNHAWNNVANVIFLESPAGVGFSYSNTTSDYDVSGDKRTAQDSLTFLLNWLERFPQYKNRDFYITGESYAGHYVPQLALTILEFNKHTNQTAINLQGIAIGNALIDDETNAWGSYDFFWTHALLPDEIHQGIILNCNFTPSAPDSKACDHFLGQAGGAIGSIYGYNIYAPFCTNPSAPNPYSDVGFDPCSDDYIQSYLNLPQVQKALHANVTGLPYQWTSCTVLPWNDSPTTILPIIQQLMASQIRVWIYSGDVDGVIPVTSTRYSINAMNLSIETPWYPWYTQQEVGGYAVGYQGLAFVTVRFSGHFVPSYQPARALTLFSSFIQGKLPPSS